AQRFREHLVRSRIDAELTRTQALPNRHEALEETSSAVLVVALSPSAGDGDTVRDIVEAAPGVPLVVLTGPASTLETKEVLRAGADEHLRSDELSPPLVAKTLRWARGRARMARQVNEREHLLRSINENISEGLYRSVEGEGLTYVNSAFVDLFGCEDPDALLRVDPRELYVNPEDRTRLRGVVRKAGQFQNEEVQFRRRDGSTFTGLLSGTMRPRDDGTEVFDGAVVDITERKEKEQRRRVLSAAIDQVNESIVIASTRPVEEGGPQL
ncbi:MAG: PAS domain S-box protein, partial [Salinibacter sp.]